MARFLTAPRRQMVNPYPEVNVDFYSNLMNQTQQNLNQATQMQASAMEQAYNLPFTSQEDYEAIVTPMKEKFEGMLDKEFVSPSEVARTIMDTRGEMQPRISALQNKAKELQMQRQLQTEWGLDWMGNDVSKMSITDTDPSQIKGINFNRNQIRDAFIQSKGAEFLKEIDSGRYQKLEGFPGENMYGRVVTSGLNDQQKAMYAPGTELAIQNANEYFNSLPESSKQDLIAITGSPEAALQSIQQTQYEAVNDPKFAYSQKVVGATQYTPSTENKNENKGSDFEPTLPREELISPEDKTKELDKTVEDLNLYSELSQYRELPLEKIDWAIKNLEDARLVRGQSSKISEARAQELGAVLESIGTNLISFLGNNPSLRYLRGPELNRKKEEARKALSEEGEKIKKINKKIEALKKIKNKGFDAIEKERDKKIQRILSEENYGAAFNAFSLQEINRLSSEGMPKEEVQAYVESPEFISNVLSNISDTERSTINASNSYLEQDKKIVQKYHTQVVTALGDSGNVFPVDTKSGEILKDSEPAKTALVGTPIAIETSPKNNSILMTIEKDDVYSTYAITKNSGISKTAKESLEVLNDLYTISNSYKGLSFNENTGEIGDIIYMPNDASGNAFEIVRDLNNNGRLRAYRVIRKEGNFERKEEVSLGAIHQYYLQFIK